MPHDKRTSMLAAAALAAAAVPVVAAPAADAYTPVRYARFMAKITGAQTTKWQSTSGTYTDCNGTRITRGEGTEVLRFDSGRPEKVLIQVNPSGSMFWKYATWSPLELDSPLGFISDVSLARHGRYTTSWSGGWCGASGSQVNPEGGGDCGRHRGIGSVVAGPYDRRLEVELLASSTKPFDDCPVNSPLAVTDGSFTDTFGRLSARLVLGRRQRIVVDDGKVYRRHDTAPGVDATSTTHFRLVLVRKRRG